MSIFSQLKIQTFGRIGIFILVATTVLILGTTYLSVREVRAIDATWTSATTRISYKRDLAARLEAHFGYDGVFVSLKAAKAALTPFNDLPIQTQLHDIQKTLDLYADTHPTESESRALLDIGTVVDTQLQALSIQRIIDIAPATTALATLNDALTLMEEEAAVKISASTRKAQWIMGSLGLSAAFLLGAIVSIFSGLFRWRIIEPLTQLSGTMETLAAGHYGVGIPFADQRDELGAMSRNIQTFRDHARAREQAEKKWRSLAEELSTAKAETQATLSRAEESEARYRHLAQHDDLTGLANRALFHTRLNEALAVAKRTRLSGAVLLLDLDRFKDVNDSLGHPAGDELLRQVAERLETQARETDTVARLGGDEFAMIATHIDRIESAGTVAEKIIALMQEPFDIHGTAVDAGTSVGISTFPADGMCVEDFLKNADIALYRAKAEGRGTWQHYDAHLDNEIHDKKNLERDLREAIKTDALEIHFQPQMNVESGTLMGAECLVRWTHPARGTVSPETFIALAENSGLIHPLGEWILQSVCKQIKKWSRAGLPDIRFAVNMSTHQLKHHHFVPMLDACLDTAGINPEQLEIEITEGTTTRNNLDGVLDTLHHIRKHGVHISIDDFGTGHSALNRLRDFPVNTLKIDQCFTQNMCHNSYDAEVVRSLINLGQSLGIGVIAEGVETAEQVAQLKADGCFHMQGYYLGRPMPSSVFYETFLKTS